MITTIGVMTKRTLSTPPGKMGHWSKLASQSAWSSSSASLHSYWASFSSLLPPNVLIQNFDNPQISSANITLSTRTFWYARKLITKIRGMQRQNIKRAKRRLKAVSWKIIITKGTTTATLQTNLKRLKAAYSSRSPRRTPTVTIWTPVLVVKNQQQQSFCLCHLRPCLT